MKLNQLITFLDVRAHGFNYRISAITAKMEKRLGQSSLFYNIECERQIHYYQDIIAGILQLLKDIVVLRDEYDWENTPGCRNRIYNKVMDSYIKKTARRNLIYNSKHPLFGFKPFKNALLKYYSNLEMFKECNELICSTDLRARDC
jgi:hypothetical protein